MKPGISITGCASASASGGAQRAVRQQPGELAAVAQLAPQRRDWRPCGGGLSGHRTHRVRPVEAFQRARRRQGAAHLRAAPGRASG